MCVVRRPLSVVFMGVLCALGGDVPVGSRPAEQRTTDNGQLTTDEVLALRPNPGPERLPSVPTWKTWLNLALILSAAATVVLLFREVSRRRQVQPQPPPHQWALAELRRLGDRPLADGEALYQLHVAVSEVLRQYLNRRFHLRALEQTTPEFSDALKTCEDLTSEQKAQVIDLLGRADLVKFARVERAAKDGSALLDAARRFVEQTSAGRAR